MTPPAPQSGPAHQRAVITTFVAQSFRARPGLPFPYRALSPLLGRPSPRRSARTSAAASGAPSPRAARRAHGTGNYFFSPSALPGACPAQVAAAAPWLVARRRWRRRGSCAKRQRRGRGARARARARRPAGGGGGSLPRAEGRGGGWLAVGRGGGAALTGLCRAGPCPRPALPEPCSLLPARAATAAASSDCAERVSGSPRAQAPWLSPRPLPTPAAACPCRSLNQVKPPGRERPRARARATAGAAAPCRHLPDRDYELQSPRGLPPSAPASPELIPRLSPCLLQSSTSS